MTWTPSDEQTWKELLKRREEEFQKGRTLVLLKEMVEVLESGGIPPTNVEVEYITASGLLDYDGNPPVIGKKVIITYSSFDERGDL